MAFMPPPKTLTLFLFVLLWTSFNVANSKRFRRQVAITFGTEPPRDANTCRSPVSPSGGTCKSIRQCEYFYQPLINGQFTPELIRIYRKSICRLDGSTPIVCCPNSPINGVRINVTTSTTTTSTTPSTTTTSTTTTPETTTTTTQTTTTTTESTSTVSSSTETTTSSTTTTPVPVTRGAEDLLPEECGIRIDITTTRITGGRIAEQGAWPWIGLLVYDIGTGQLEFLCGSTLITNQHVITAAHCTERRDDILFVRLGEHDILDDTEANHLDVPIGNIIDHGEYNAENFENDISIIRLENPVEFTSKIIPACLPRSSFFKDNDLAGTNGFVAGWGAISFNNVSSPILKEAQLPIRTNELCDKAYENFTNIIVDHRRLCAGTGGNDACQGDSGGPLIVFDPTERKFTLVGVVSVGYKCASPDFPGIYSRISSYFDWIISNLG